MKKILGKTLLLSLFACLISLQGLLAQDARTLLKFEDAEKAYDKGNYQQVISLLDEVESQTGVTSRTLFLRIVAAYGQLDSAGSIYENQNGFQQLTKLRASAANYLKHLASQPIDDKYRRIYEISKALDSFPESFDKWKLKYESLSRQKEQAHLMDANCIFEMVYTKIYINNQLAFPLATKCYKKVRFTPGLLQLNALHGTFKNVEGKRNKKLYDKSLKGVMLEKNKTYYISTEMQKDGSIQYTEIGPTAAREKISDYEPMKEETAFTEKKIN